MRRDWLLSSHSQGTILRTISVTSLILVQASHRLSCIAFQGRGFAASSEEGKASERSLSIDGEKDSLATDLEQATGLERCSLELLLTDSMQLVHRCKLITRPLAAYKAA